ncbi:MAG: hypothetical protein EXR50_00995 [Dehalococcoidia bacterium]|nr:hypothetical protein [Dehalococcoidia bacterium]
MAEFISKRDQDFLREKFDSELSNDVTVNLFSRRETRITLPGVDPQVTEYCAQANQLMNEVASLSNKINLNIYDFITDASKAQDYRIDKVPAIVLESAGSSGAPRFFGLPAGYEFSTFLQDILDVSNGNIDLSDETQQQLREITKEVHILVFTTPT